MKKVISDYHINTQLLDMINESEKYLILISPYITLWGHLEDGLFSSIERGVDVKLYFRSDKEEEYLYKLKPLKKMGVKLFHIHNLHTKLYLSEKKGIMSSMNLVDYSTKNSKEMGLVSDDEDMLKMFKKYSKELTSKSIKSKKSFLRKGVDLVEGVIVMKDDIKQLIKDEGVCIRCLEGIPFNPNKPYCRKHFISWNKYKNKNYTENYCHMCRVEWKTSIRKPICKDCFKEMVV